MALNLAFDGVALDREPSRHVWFLIPMNFVHTVPCHF